MPVKKTAVKKRLPIKRSVPESEPKSEQYFSRTSAPLKLYRQIAITFTILVSATLCIVFYLSTMNATIEITPIRKVVHAEETVRVTSISTKETDIAGVVATGTIKKTQTVLPTGEGKKEIEDIATGTVTIRNTGVTDQSLVATTRLLSSEGVLFRLTRGVVVPSNGEIETEVYADKAGASGNIAPTRFSIPGLSAARQAVVYAESQTPFSGGVRTVAVVSEEEMMRAADLLEQALVDEAKVMLIDQAPKTVTGQVFQSEVIEQTFSEKPDTEVEAYDVTVQVSLTGVFYDELALQQIALQRLYASLGKGMIFSEIDLEALSITIDGWNEKTGEALLSVSLEATAVPSLTHEKLNVDRFVGLTENEVSELLIQEGIAESVHVSFFPFWMTRVPRLEDHIFIKVLP